MNESITFAKDLIDVLNYISEKLGATIAWGNAELVPYLKELGSHIVAYKEGIAWMCLVLAAVITIAGIVFIIMSVVHDDGVYLAIGCICVIVGVIIALYNGNTIIACRTFPEKVILDYITTIKSSAVY